MARWSVRRKVYGLLLLSFLVPAVVWGLSEVVTRDSTQTPCPAVDDSTGECRNLRYNAVTKGLDVNLVGTGTITVGAIGGNTTPTDAFTNPTTAVINTSLNSVWNGSAWDRLASASAASFAAGISKGSATAEKGGRWSVYASPSAGTQGTITRPAGVGGVRHVADCISYSLSAANAPAVTLITLNLRDGTTGAGTVLWSKQFVATSTVGSHINGDVCGLNINGSAATAMTLEFTPALANEVQTVALTGYDIQ